MLAILFSLIISSSTPAGALQQAPAKATLTGAWTLNTDLSDKPPERDDDSRGGRRGGGGYGRRGGGGGGLGGRGGFGGGMGRGGGRAGDPQEMERMREAMRDLTQASDHLTIVETASMVIITSSDGRTTRLSPDGKKIKDEHTNMERRTKWDGGKLVSEIDGLGRGKVTQTFSVDPDSRKLRIVLSVEGGRNMPARTITHVYDADSR